MFAKPSSAEAAPGRRASFSLRTAQAVALSAAVVAGTLGAVPQAVAQPVRAGLAPLSAHVPSVASEAQARRYRPGPQVRPGWRPPPPQYHARWGRPYWRNGGWYYRNNNGAWIAAGLAGLALGAAAGAAAAQSGPRYDDAVAYCMQRFRSYDPRTGTYLGYDGLRHPCP